MISFFRRSRRPDSYNIDRSIRSNLRARKKAAERRKKHFDLPEFNIRTVHASALGKKVINRYAVGSSTVLITDQYEYLVDDPPLSQEEKMHLAEIASNLLFMIPTDAVNDGNRFESYLEASGLSDERFKYLLRREILGYGPLEPLVGDPKVEDIIVASPKHPVSCSHSDYGIMPTNISFTAEEADAYVEKLVHLCGKSISLFRPIMSIRLPNGSRLSVSYKKEVSMEGSNFVIRKFPEKPWSITSLMVLNTLPPEMAGWLMVLEEYRKAFLVCGSMGTGKTSMINALCNLIPERSVIVTIEDTPELRLAHPNRISLVVREPVTLDEKGEIGMFELVKESLRMSADYIIVGEVRGEEGRVWAQAIMTGHGGITSLHAESPRAAIERLLSDPISVEKGTLRSLSGILYLAKFSIRNDRKMIQRRRAINFYDIDKDFNLTPLFKYDSERDLFSYDEGLLLESNVAARIIDEFSIEKNDFLKKVRSRIAFLRKLTDLAKVQPEYSDYSEVARSVWAFQSSPKKSEMEKGSMHGKCPPAFSMNGGIRCPATAKRMLKAKGMPATFP
ncbi:MAG: type II/IV secretion system ATPase subunit [Candidatus Methanomethylicia archaeon]|nr:type II/IV secretion system ATPase subunit [Candidatus Methanomethylicia archaeon]